MLSGGLPKCEREVKEGLVKLDTHSCRMTEYVTIPYSNDSQNIEDGWLVSSSTGVPTENAKSLTPLLDAEWWIAKVIMKERRKRD